MRFDFIQQKKKAYPLCLKVAGLRGILVGNIIKFEPMYLQNYVDELIFRFNFRKPKGTSKKFMSMVEQAVKSIKIIYS